MFLSLSHCQKSALFIEHISRFDFEQSCESDLPFEHLAFLHTEEFSDNSESTNSCTSPSFNRFPIMIP